MDLAVISLPLAHAGHWALWVLYAVPVVVVVASIVFTIVRERRAARNDSADGATRSPSP